MNSDCKRLITAASAVTLAMTAPVLQAQTAASPGLYLGAGAGVANFEDEVEVGDIGDVDIDDDSTAYKFYGGYLFTPHLALEGGYRSFGEAEAGPFSVETTGWDASVVGFLPVGPIDLFARGGMIFWQTDGAGGVPDRDDEDLTYGLGGQLNIGTLFVRLESEWFDIDFPDDTQMITASAGLRF